jgi:hypothetical protein
MTCKPTCPSGLGAEEDEHSTRYALKYELVAQPGKQIAGCLNTTTQFCANGTSLGSVTSYPEKLVRG